MSSSHWENQTTFSRSASGVFWQNSRKSACAPGFFAICLRQLAIVRQSLSRSRAISGERLRPVPHPSVQVGQYEQWLLDNHTVFYDDAVEPSVRPADGKRFPAGGWSVPYGTGQAEYPASSALPETEVASFQIWSGGQDLLNIPVT